MEMAIFQKAIRDITEISAEEMLLFKGIVSYRTLKKGELLLAEDHVCRSVYLVDKGHLRTWYNKDGEIINLNFTFEGEFTGDLKSALSRLPSTYNITAGENTSLWIFDLNKLTPGIKSHPTIGRFIRQVTLRMLLASESRAELLKIYTPAERYHFIEQHSPRLLQRISLSQMASYLAVTRKTLSRIRKNKTAGTRL